MSKCVIIILAFHSLNSLTCILIDLLPIPRAACTSQMTFFMIYRLHRTLTVSLIVSNYPHGQTHNRKHATLPEMPETNQLRLLLLPKELETNTRLLFLESNHLCLLPKELETNTLHLPPPPPPPPPPLRLSWLPPVSSDTHGCHGRHSIL